MKKIIKPLIFISACILISLALASCSDEHTTHKPGDVVIENEIKATCTSKGSYDEVVYCSVCDEELSRETKKTDKLEHTLLAPVRENDVAPSCVFDGGYDMVAYCSVCNAAAKTVHMTLNRHQHEYQGNVCKVCNGSKSSEGLKFELNEDQKSYTLVGIGICKSKDIVIGLHNDLPVTAIGYRAFMGNKSIETVTFGTQNWIKEFEISAFNGCSNLKEIRLPNSLETMGIDCFMDCRSLGKVVFGNSLKTIPASAFSNCFRLTEVVFTNSITVIGGSAFMGCSRLKNVVLPTNLLSISSQAFMQCAIEEIVVPNSVKEIQDKAFGDCRNLRSITLGNSLKTLASTAFYQCYSLKGVILPESLERMRSYTFHNCVNLDYIVISKSITTIESSTFFLCSTPNLFYCGTAADWAKISIGTENTDYQKIYYYSETQPTDATNAYWRYVDGVPTPWEAQ